ncbi:MAG: hypothetical protein JST43_01005 [Bacteroidetes bacterium]|nr:hypothetical protein [Bacteroidota bacterium]MBS1540663.1 hypothetical protein [Bacteroidota bacterium]
MKQYARELGSDQIVYKDYLESFNSYEDFYHSTFKKRFPASDCVYFFVQIDQRLRLVRYSFERLVFEAMPIVSKELVFKAGEYRAIRKW